MTPIKIGQPNYSSGSSRKGRPQVKRVNRYTYHSTLAIFNSRKYIIKSSIFDCGMPKEWIIFEDLT